MAITPKNIWVNVIKVQFFFVSLWHYCDFQVVMPIAYSWVFWHFSEHDVYIHYAFFGFVVTIQFSLKNNELKNPVKFYTLDPKSHGWMKI